MVSIDGKIDVKFMDEPKSDPVGDYYEDQKNKNGKAWANGSNTHVRFFGYHNVDYLKYDITNIDYSDYVIIDEKHNYIITFDTKGKCNCIKNIVDYFGESRDLMVLSKLTPKSYLAHLRTLEIPYIIAGEESINLKLALEKLKELFGIETIILCGGSVINGAFIKENLVDELSLVIAPYVEGSEQYSIFNTFGYFNNKEYKLISAKEISGNGVHLRFCKLK